MEESIKQHLMELERRVQQQFGELQTQCNRISSDCVDERNRLEERTIQAVNSMIDGFQQRITNVERKTEEEQIDEELTGRVEDLETEQANFRQQVLKTFKELESRINRMADEQYEQQRKSIDDIRDEMRQGLQTMHDTMTNMKSVLENKIRMSEENLQIELAQLRKLVVLV
ncbi:unnamed protein product [Echinostoma caproni]|uniref:t-SNARE coiled-coil homology domain-containing protein n=1 Tax=Echinostoma caproni TaxID=27848 RepID=A0A183AVG6_9TREM|nr:unnamed protein product [Echinostoma caproni]